MNIEKRYIGANENIIEPWLGHFEAAYVFEADWTSFNGFAEPYSN